MKLTTKEKKRIGDFQKKYLDKSYKIDWNTIKLSKADGEAHNIMVANVCIWCIHNDIPFVTQCRFITGYRPDILCPIRMPKYIVEVRNTETEKESNAKLVRIPAELQNSIIYIDANKPFIEKMLL